MSINLKVTLNDIPAITFQLEDNEGRILTFSKEDFDLIERELQDITFRVAMMILMNKKAK